MRWELFLAILIITIALLWIFRGDKNKEREPVSINPNVLLHYCLDPRIPIPGHYRVRPVEPAIPYEYEESPSREGKEHNEPQGERKDVTPPVIPVEYKEFMISPSAVETAREGVVYYDLPERKPPIYTPLPSSTSPTLVSEGRYSGIPPVLPSPPYTRRPMTGRSTGTISKGQRICWEAVEELTGHEFKVNLRPDFLKNTGIGGRPATGRNLELDLYNDTLKIAIEYNGGQHYEYPHRYNNGPDPTKLFEYDEWKRKRCDEKGIYLIPVSDKIPFTAIKEYIKGHLRRIYTLPEGR